MLAILALAVASHGFAQQGSGPPDAGKGASGAQGPAGNPYLTSLDPQGERFQRDLERAEAGRKAAASAKSQTYAAEGGNLQGTPWTTSLSQRLGLAVLAGIGLFVALAAGGYVWWTRSQALWAESVLLPAVRRETAAQSGGTEHQDEIPKRRAA